MPEITRRNSLKIALAAPFVIAAGRLEAQQNWPNRPILIVLPFAAGGGADTMMRVVCAKISENVKQPVVIENKTGGASVAGASYVQSLPKDGYTFFNNSSQHIITPLLVKDLPFDYSKVFVPVSKTAAYPQAITVNQDSAFKTPRDLIDYARANPGKLKYGTPPRGGMGHMAALLVEIRTDTKFLHVPYRGAPDAPRDLAAGGLLDCVFTSTSTNMPFIQSGRIRPIAVTSPKRVAVLPDTPTLDETILPGYDMDDWSALFAAAGTPDWAVNRMQEVFAEACRDPGVIARMKPLGTELVASSPKDFEKFIAEQRVTLGDIVKKGNVTVE